MVYSYTVTQKSEEEKKYDIIIKLCYEERQIFLIVFIGPAERRNDPDIVGTRHRTVSVFDS